MIQAWNKLFSERFWTNKQIQMKTQSARQHLHPHQNLRIFKILMTHMNCNKDGKSLTLGKMQSPKQIMALQGTNGPWQKLRAFTLTKFIVLQVSQKFRQTLWQTQHYCTTVQPLSKKQIMLAWKQKHFRPLRHVQMTVRQKQIPSYLKGHALSRHIKSYVQISELIDCFQLYMRLRATKLKTERIGETNLQSEFTNSLCTQILLSFSLNKLYFIFCKFSISKSSTNFITVSL